MLDNIRNATDLYTTVVDSTNNTSKQRENAQFIRDVMIEPVYALSAIKGTLDYDGDASISSCDINNNDTADEADAASCALLMIDADDYLLNQIPDDIPQSIIDSLDLIDLLDGADLGLICTSELSTSFIAERPVTFASSSHTYVAQIFEIENFGSVSSCPTRYSRLLAPNGEMVTTTSDMCRGSDGVQYNCPYEDASGQPVEFVSMFERAMNAAVNTARSDDRTHS